MKRSLFVLVVFLSFFFGSTKAVYPRLGVGIGTGKIVVDEEIKAGVIYDLPVITILNTGDEASEYGVQVTYHQDQTEKRPPQEWFEFFPEEFSLEPGDGEVVAVKLNLPINAEPGDYFAYLEGYPLKKDQSGGTSIGIAAASKLYFTIAPSNMFEGIYYKIASLYSQYLPWTNIIVVVLVVVVILVLLKRFFNFSVSVKKKEKEHIEEEEDE